MSAEQQSVIIVGAGLVGSLLATLLANEGFRVRVYERRGDMRSAGYTGGRSINLAMSDRGWRAIRMAGIADRIAHVAIPMRGRQIHNEQGETIFQQYGKDDQAIYSVSRGGLNIALMDCADTHPGVKFFFNHRCTDVRPEEGTAIFVDDTTGNTVEDRAEIVIGADGAYSAVRSHLEHQDRFNFSKEYLAHGYKELNIPAGSEGSFLIEKEALHIWPRHSYMMIALPNPDGSFTCTLFLPFEGEKSFEALASPQAVREFFATEFPDAVPLMPTLVEDFERNPTASLVTVRCAPWVWRKRVVLIGDAAHAIVPFYGQGMNAGFEDCSILIELLREHGNDWQAVLPLYQQKRKPNGDAVANLALRNFEEMKDHVADPKFLLRKKVEKRLHELFPEKFTPVYSMVSFSHTPYAEAWSEQQRQDHLMERFFHVPNLEEVWDKDDFVDIAKVLMATY